MIELKGIEKVEKIINNFTAQFGVTAMFDTEFEAFCDEKKVGYTLIGTSESNGNFIEDAVKRYPEVNADIFLWALMHEIGHCLTDYQWTEAEKEYFWMQKDAISESEVDWEYMNTWYHAIPDEFAATQWAGEFMRNHPKKMARFWKKLQKALMDMYNENGLLGE